jgi:hypothetical protein
MSDFIDGKALRQLLLGKKVDRDADTHTNATHAHFEIHTGRVLMTGLVGKCTVVSAANDTIWEAVPTTGTAQPVCGILDIDPVAVGDSMTITGKANDAMTYNASASGLPMMTYGGVVLNVGTLNLHPAAADGASSWTLFYVPIDDGAHVVATAI